MTLGVLALNLLFLLVGLGIVFAARGWECWRDVLGDLGLAYIFGLAAIGVVAHLALVAGRSLSGATILVLVTLALVASAVVGARRGRPLPRGFGRRLSLPRTVGDLLSALAAAATLALALLIYVAFRHQPLAAYDAWNFWIPKAKVIYFFNGIDNRLFPTLPAPSYPLFAPALDAMVFRFTHSTDPAVLAQQSWFVLAGFVGAVASLLAPIARRGLVWVFLAGFLLLPELQLRWFQLLADWTLDSFLVVAALLFARWLITREGWLLAVMPIPLAAMLITKREGQLFILCFVAGALAATVRERRRAWPRIGAIAVTAYVVSQLPWRIWWTVHHLPSDLNAGGTGHTGSVHRALASAHIVAELLFNRSGWLLAVPLALAAAAAVILARRPAAVTTFYVVTSAFLFVGLTWVMWSAPTMPLTTSGALNPTVREVASIASLSVMVTPILVSLALGAQRVPAFELELATVRSRVPRWRAALLAAPPLKVLGALVVAQWAIVLGIAVTVRHQGWIFYQGGDQLWYYTTGWLLVHGHFPQPGIGYLWPVLLAPIAAVAGPDVANAYPAIVVVQFLFLLPIALLALFGLATRIGGRLFGYWSAALWLLVPLIGVKFTEPGYHERYTEVLLPQGFGLTAMGDFPSTVAALVSAYFCARALTDEPRTRTNALVAGLAGGAAFAVKPATALILVGPFLAFAVARRARECAHFAVGLVPALIGLTFVKWRGFGYLPILHPSATSVRVAAGAGTQLALAGVGGLGHYLHFDRHIFLNQLDLVREHFWSVRVVEWLVIGGLLGLLFRSKRYAALVFGWFFPIVLLKSGSGRADIEGGNLLRVLMPAYPAFVLLIAAIPYLFPGLARHAVAEPRRALPPLLSARGRTTAIVAAVLVTAVIPMAAWAVAKPIRSGPPTLPAAILQQPPIPLGVDVGLRAARTGKHAVLTWNAQHASGGPVFYHVFRKDRQASMYTCSAGSGAEYCVLSLTDLGATKSTSFTDTSATTGATYYVGVAANWLDDTTQGDVYVLSSGVSVR